MKTRIQLKEELRTSEDLMGVVDAMKQIATTQLRHLEKLRLHFDEFSRALLEFFQWMAFHEVQHPFFQNEVPARLWVLITSDMGFLGGLNSAVVNEGLSDFQVARGDGVAVVGERGKALLVDLGHDPKVTFPGISGWIERQEVRAVKKFMVEQILAGRFGGATVVYPRYESITRQRIEKFELFPCQGIPILAVPFPEGTGSSSTGTEPVPSGIEGEEERFFLESPIEEIIAYLVELWTSERLHQFFWHSKLSELAARALHLDESHQRLNEERKRWRYLYIRRVHEETDRNIREIVAARSQMRNRYAQRTR